MAVVHGDWLDAGGRMLTPNEVRYCDEIRDRDERLRAFLASHSLSEPPDPIRWYRYLGEARAILGNLSNSASFVATLLAKSFLCSRFDLQHFDAANKPQGASGHDVEGRTLSGERIVGEIKTTVPYQGRDFGANQRKEILKDLDKLARSDAAHRFMFLTERSAFEVVCLPKYAARAPGVVIVSLLTDEVRGV